MEFSGRGFDSLHLHHKQKLLSFCFRCVTRNDNDNEGGFFVLQKPATTGSYRLGRSHLNQFVIKQSPGDILK